MDQGGEPKTEPKTSSAAAPGHLGWDTSELQSHRCTVATVSVIREKIVLNFGAKLARDPRAGEVAVELLERRGQPLAHFVVECGDSVAQPGDRLGQIGALAPQVGNPRFDFGGLGFGWMVH